MQQIAIWSNIRPGHGAFLFLLVGLSWVDAQSAQALDNFFTGANSNSWHDVANWRFMGSITPIPRVPSDGDVAVLNNTTLTIADYVTLMGHTAAINGLKVLGDSDLRTNGYLLRVDNNGNGLTELEVPTGNAAASILVDPRIGGGTAFETDNLSLGRYSFVTLMGGDVVVHGTTSLTGGQLVQHTGVQQVSSVFFGGDVFLNDYSNLRFKDGNFAPSVQLLAENNSVLFFDQTFSVVDNQVFELRSDTTLSSRSLRIGDGSAGSLLADGMGTKIDMTYFTSASTLTIGNSSSGSGIVQLTDLAELETGTGAISVLATGQLNVAGGSFHGRGNMTVNGGTVNHTSGEFKLDAGRNLTVTNNGQVSLTGIRFIDGNATYLVNTGGDLTFDSLLGIGWNAGPGTLTVDGPGSTLTVNSTLQLGSGDNQTDRVNIRNGAHAAIESLAIVLGSGPGETFNGEVRVESGSAAEVSGFVSVGVGPLAPGGTGELHVIGGSTLMHTNNDVVSYAEHTRVGSESGVWGTIFVGRGGTYHSSIGDIDIRPRGKLDLFGDDSGPGTFHANGHVILQGEIDIHRQGPVSNPGGVLNVNDGLEINGGTVYLYEGEIHADEITLNSGGFEFLGGLLSVENFNGSLVQEGGTLAPGNSAGGTTVNGDYALQSEATLAIEIGGLTPVTQHDFLSVTGNAQIQGILELSVIDGFVPQAEDAFTILSTPSFTGAFANVASGSRLTTSDGFGSFLVSYDPAGGAATDVVLSDFIATDSADFDLDGDVDADDLAAWQQAYSVDGAADADRDGDSDGADLLAWQRQFGKGLGSPAVTAVPEPVTAVMVVLLSTLILPFGRNL